MTRQLRVDLFTDIVCPWCLVGAARLDQAIARLPEGIAVQVVNHPFYLDPNTPPEGYVVAAGPISATEILSNRKRRPFTLRQGDVVALIGAANGEATLALPAGTRALAPVQGLVGVVAPYPLPGMPPVEPGMLYGIKLGEYVSYAEGLRAWKEFTAGPGSAYRDLPPMVWPVFRKGRLLYEVGVAPFSRLQVDTACGTLAQRGLDCTVIELDTF